MSSSNVSEWKAVAVWSIETMEWVTPASSLKWSQERTRRVNTSWHVANTLFVAGVSMHAWNGSKTLPSFYRLNLIEASAGLSHLLKSSQTSIQPHSHAVTYFFSSVGKNKRVGKQLASQKILQMLHPHVKNWGSLLRMYGRESNKMVKKVSALFYLLHIFP